MNKINIKALWKTALVTAAAIAFIMLDLLMLDHFPKTTLSVEVFISVVVFLIVVYKCFS